MVNGSFLFAPAVGKSCRANMVNKTFLPRGLRPAKHLTPLKTAIFRVGTAFAE
jgi:hypothetical protein